MTAEIYPLLEEPEYALVAFNLAAPGNILWYRWSLDGLEEEEVSPDEPDDGKFARKLKVGQHIVKLGVVRPGIEEGEEKKDALETLTVEIVVSPSKVESIKEIPA